MKVSCRSHLCGLLLSGLLLRVHLEPVELLEDGGVDGVESLGAVGVVGVAAAREVLEKVQTVRVALLLVVIVAATTAAAGLVTLENRIAMRIVPRALRKGKTAAAREHTAEQSNNKKGNRECSEPTCDEIERACTVLERGAHMRACGPESERRGGRRGIGRPADLVRIRQRLIRLRNQFEARRRLLGIVGILRDAQSRHAN